MNDVEGDQVRVVVVAPTYDNVRTLPALLDGLRDLGLPVIVVNDGCTDGSEELLYRWVADNDAGKWVVAHPSNRGKAAALHSGFERAGALGFTHALTIDTDGQHDVADIAPLLRATREQPRALVIGARPLTTDTPFGSRIGRAISNHCAWLESGARVTDSQSGLRVYPLQATLATGAGTRRYAFETEIITRLAWARVPVIEVPIRCIYDVAGSPVSHFRPWLDSTLAALMHVKLIARSLLPWPVHRLGPRDARTDTGTVPARLLRWMNPLTVWRQIRQSATERKQFAASMAAGIFIATIPAYGVKTVLCLLIAKWLRLQPVVVIAVSSLNTPPVGPLLAAASIATGHVVLHGRFLSLAKYDPFRVGVWDTLRAVAAEWIVGSLIVGTFLAVLAYLLGRLMMLAMPALKPHEAKHRIATAA